MSKEKWQELKEIPIDDYLEEKEKEMEKEDWHTTTELGLREQIDKTKTEQKLARKQAKAKKKQDERIAKMQGKLKTEEERLDRIRDGTSTFCDRHPKICKAGKAAAVTGAAVGSAALIGAAVVSGDGAALGGLAGGMDTKQRKSPSKTKTAPKRSTNSSRSRTTASKTKTAPKRSASTAKRRTTSQTARKPTQKRTTVKRTTKSTPKKKTPKRPRNNDWWGAGDAGL